MQRTIVQGHFQGVADKPEVWGLAVHPKSQKFASAGADKTVRLWSPSKMEAVSAQLTHDPTALDWNSAGDLIAVGDRNGTCLLLDATTLEVKSTYNGVFSKKKHTWVEDIKFSPDGQYIAYGYHGGASPMEVVQVTSQKKLKKHATVKVGLTSALSHLDWSQDGQLVMVNSQANELMFISVAGKTQVSASSTKDTEW